MKTKNIRLDEIRFDEDEVDETAIEKHVPLFLVYRNQWKEYNLAKKAGQNPKLPEFPYDTIRVYKIEDTYLPIDVNASAILFAARKVEINLVKVIVQEPVVNQDGLSLDEPPIHANRLFADFKTTIKCLQATNPQRVEFFKPILRAIFNEGFTDESSRTEFLKCTRTEIERY